ncbi:RNA 2',3'-cyclic phosphodiesterase [Sphingomonas sp. EC-HK361]|uniref:RNA 2',3'-cyclic phosphodiesterase n=1 Tax=Sphingomonas sp. EC-HK361 TaxID=2038397 RepID=UPI00125205A3|nr:RNA 2',3'-cyclic phosphodiesterase [Sphingomonas sp. EC-HK361]VVT08570.1 RNA 2',3'-cyclic phosphodiesterase [Sphingomonas sp. EC-HK361]
MIRLFVALRPPRAVRRVLLDLAGGVPGARWQDDAQLHLTLRYIGEVDERVAEDVAIALSQLRAPVPTVHLGGVGRFANRGRTDVLWAGVAPHDALVALHRKIDRALVRLGLPPEHRAFLPHITLARLPRSAGAEGEVDAWIAANLALTSAPFAIDRIVLNESTLGRDGARYDVLAQWPLNAVG